MNEYAGMLLYNNMTQHMAHTIFPNRKLAWEGPIYMYACMCVSK